MTRLFTVGITLYSASFRNAGAGFTNRRGKRSNHTHKVTSASAYVSGVLSENSTLVHDQSPSPRFYEF
jgi:hypothetical protein